MILEVELEVGELVFFAFGATHNRSMIHETIGSYQYSVEVESMSRRQIEVAVRYVWRERGAADLDGSHVVRPILKVEDNPLLTQSGHGDGKVR